MNVLIINGNKTIFEELIPKVKFEVSTENTSTFRISEKKFIVLRNHLRELGYNPYSIMHW